jgi:hypothetical protein
MSMVRVLVMGLTVVSVAACASTPGEVCVSDDDCSDGFQCLELDSGTSACSVACEDDGDCAVIDDGACSNGVCLSRATSDLPFAAVCEDDAECGEGLRCIAFAIDGLCTDKTCTIECADDDTCGDLGRAAQCFATCEGAPSVCGATG